MDNEKYAKVIVKNITDEKEVNINYKEIFDILDEYPIFKEEDINLIKWMRNRYLCTFMDCILLLHPKGYKVDSFKEISLSRELENLDIESFYTKIDSLNKNRKFVINKIIQNKNKIKVEKLIKENEELIKHDTLTVNIKYGEKTSDSIEMNINGENLNIDVKKI